MSDEWGRHVALTYSLLFMLFALNYAALIAIAPDRVAGILFIATALTFIGGSLCWIVWGVLAIQKPAFLYRRLSDEVDE